MVLNQVLEPLLRPLLDSTGSFWTLLLVSIFVSLLTTLVYKYTTDQNHLKSLKADLKRYQKKISDASKKNPEKALKLQKDVMKLNGEYMKHSMKSTLYTFLPIILFFGWLSANLAFAPLMVDQPFDVTLNLPEGVSEPATLMLVDGLSTQDTLTQNSTSGQVNWSVSGKEGLYDVSIKVADEEQFFQILISSSANYLPPVTEFDESAYFSSIVLGNEKLLLFDGIPLLGSIPWIKTFGWFGAYFLFSIIFSTSLRKALKLA